MEGIENKTPQISIDIDPRFRMRAEVSEDTMESNSLYMNAIAYMSTLGQADFNGVLQAADIISMAPWNDVAITLLPTANNLQRRHVIWGVYKGLDFARASNWHVIGFFLVWDNVVVGRLQFISVAPSSDKAGHITATCGNGTAPDGNIISPEWSGKVNCINSLDSPSLDSASNTARITLSPSYLSNARSLSADRIYNSIAGAITHLAEEGAGNRLDNLQWNEQDYYTNINLVNLGPETAGPRIYTNGLSMRALWRMTLWIDQQRRYDECKTQVKISGRVVGRIDITDSAAATLL